LRDIVWRRSSQALDGSGCAMAAGGAGRASVKASCAHTRQAAAKKIANAARGNIDWGEINSHATCFASSEFNAAGFASCASFRKSGSRQSHSPDPVTAIKALRFPSESLVCAKTARNTDGELRVRTQGSLTGTGPIRRVLPECEP